VSRPRIWRLETARVQWAGGPETTEKLIGALETAGIIFIDADGAGGVPFAERTTVRPAGRAHPCRKPVSGHQDVPAEERRL